MNWPFSMPSCSAASLLAPSRRSLRILSAALGTALAACGGAASESGDTNAPYDGVHPLLGKPAPDFTEKAVGDGATISLHGLAGKVAIVDFWATWCEPCKKSFPRLMPSTFILDRSGRIRFVHLGYHDAEEALIEREIKSLL